MKLYLTIIMGWLCIFASHAQPADLVLSSPESGIQLHQATNSITFAAGYSYTPNGGTMTAEIVLPAILPGSIEFASVINPYGYSVNTSLPVGKIPGITDVEGMLNYTMPIDVPKGTNSLEPEIFLKYFSGYSNGPLGLGWKIEGLSAITRVNNNVYFDNTSQPVRGSLYDKYAIDGNRMVATGGTTYGADSSTYATEMADFSKIIAHGSTGKGPEYFTVYSRSGLIYEYGNTPDSKVRREDTCILSWKLNKVSDRFGNYITYNYSEDDDEKPIARIDYTGNSTLSKDPFAHIYFRYKSRQDITSYVYGGAEFQRKLLLDHIEMRTTDGVYKKYEMGYCLVDNHAHLLKVSEVSSQGQQFNPTVFGWSDQAESYSQTTPFTFSGEQLYFPGDFNGDGRTDLVLVPNDGSDKFKLYLANSTGGMYYQSEGNLQPKFQTFLMADFDADGKCDLMLVSWDGTFDFYFYKSFGTSFDKSYRYWFPDDDLLHRDDEPISWSVCDYNGDNRLEILTERGGFYALYTYDGNLICYGTASFGTPDLELRPTSGPYQLVDFNGDGCTDILTLYPDRYDLYEFKGENHKLIRTAREYNKITNKNLIMLGDFTGDGLTNILRTDSPVDATWSMMSYENGQFKDHFIEGLSDFNVNVANNVIIPMDANGDGLKDLLFAGRGRNLSNPLNRLNIAINKGNGYDFELDEYISSVTFNFGDYKNPSFVYSGDFNGDGTDEFFYSEPSRQKCFSFGAGTPSHLLTGIIDGMGVKTTISYRPMTDNTVYTKAGGSVYPLMDLTSTQQLVSQTNTDNGVGGTTTVTYKYYGAKGHLQGQGFLGFRKTTEVNTATGVARRNIYDFNETYYFAQLRCDDIYPQETDDYIETYLETITNFWTTVGFGNKRFFPYISSSTKRDDLKSLLETTTTVYEKPTSESEYANLKSVSTDFGGGHTRATSFLYASEIPGNWLIGRPTTITETSVRDSQTKTFTTLRAYLANTNSPDVDQFNTGDPAWWKLDREYDGFGNLWKEHRETTGLTAQNTVYTYDTGHGVNLLSTTDLAGIVTNYTYDPTLGRIKTVTDQFGNLTTYNYNNKDQLSSIVPTGGISNTITSSLSVSGGPSYARYYVLQTRGDGSQTKTWFDKLGRELRTETKNFSGSMVKVDKQYNGKGQLYRVSEPTTGTPSYWNVIGYDDYGRVNSQDPYYGATSTYSFEDATTTKTVNGRTYTSTVDAAGLVVERSDPGGDIYYYYWPDGALKTTVAPGNVNTSMTYDKNGNRLTITDPSAGTITNTWYGTGQPKTASNADNEMTTYSYQPDGLTDYYTSPEGTTDYSYNASKQVSSITSPGGVSRSCTYDTKGRVYSITESIGGVSNTITYEYDFYGRLSKRYFNGMTDCEQYVYNSYGYLYQVKFNGTISGN